MVTAADLIAFESDIRAEWEAGNLPCLLHLCGGNEERLIEIFGAVRPGDWIFSTHRNHYHALLAGIPATRVKAEIMAGRSMFMFSREHNFYSSAILAGTCAIAAGVAWTIKENSRRDAKTQSSDLRASAPLREPHVWCFLGDGAEEEGHFYEAALFVEANDLPCTFIIEDNGRQVDTPKSDRRGLFHSTHAPLDHFHCIGRYHYEPTYPHAGSGAKPGTITFQPAAIERLKAQS